MVRLREEPANAQQSHEVARACGRIGEHCCLSNAAAIGHTGVMKHDLLEQAHPDLWEDALRYPFGLHAVSVLGEANPLLILKATQQFLLTARMNKGFKIYVVPLETEVGPTVGLLSAFFDDADNPLTLWTPLAEGVDSFMIVWTLMRSTITVRLFDEHNRELLGYLANVERPLLSQVRLEQSVFRVMTHDLAHHMHEQATLWFITRTDSDDLDAISVNFDQPLYEENRRYIDDRPDLFKFKGAGSLVEVRLDKLEPGQFQEIDIIFLLQKLFKPEQIFHSPKRPNNFKEIADIIILTEQVCLVIQAKDSPNTEVQLANTLDRKRSAAQNHLKKACKQLARSVAHLRQNRPLTMRMDYGDEVVEIGERPVLCLAIVRELFPADYSEYSEHLYELHKKTYLPCIGIDYGELIQYMTFCDSEESFITAYFQVFDKALEGNGFPRLRFGVNDLFDEDGIFRFN